MTMVFADKDLVYQQLGDFLPFGHIKRVRPSVQLKAKLRQRLR
jgi:hypothetical protein